MGLQTTKPLLLLLLFTGFYATNEERDLLPLLNEAWHYLKNIASDIDGYIKTRLIDVVPRACNLIKDRPKEKHVFYKLDDSIDVALVYNEETSIFNQLQTLITPHNKIKKITVICPYYDEDGESIINLKN